MSLTIPHSAMHIDQRTANELLIGVGFGFNGGHEWPKEYAFGPYIFEFEGNAVCPRHLASTYGGYARYVRTERRTHTLKVAAPVITSAAPVFKVERRIVTAFKIDVPATVQVPYPKECDPWLTQVTVAKLVDGEWVPGSPISELKREKPDGEWKVVSHLQNERNELGHITGIEISYWFTEPGEYQVWFDWTAIEDKKPKEL